MGLPKKILNAYDVEFIDSWAPPEGEDLRPLIGMPNIPKPLHHVNPRNLLGQNTWNHMRRRCYALANDTCEICGTKPENLRQRHAHEVYEIDYKKGTVKFVRAFCVCSLCHLGGIHTGRALTLWKQKNPLYPTEFLLKGAENAFRIIYEYNQEHPDNEVKAYSTFLDYLKHDELKEPMEGLIYKYNIQFYEETKNKADWGKWKLIVGNREYPTPYADEKEWEKAMEEAGKKDTARIYGRRKKKFLSTDDVEISDQDLERIEKAEIPEGF